MAGQFRARRRRHDTALCAVDQCGAEGGFEVGQPFAESRGGDVLFLGRPRDTARARNRPEEPQGNEIVAQSGPPGMWVSPRTRKSLSDFRPDRGYKWIG